MQADVGISKRNFALLRGLEQLVDETVVRLDAMHLIVGGYVAQANELYTIMSPDPKAKATDLDDRMKWWRTYEPLDYMYRARPYGTFKSYIEEVFEPLERTQRCASSVRFLYQRDVEPGYMPRSRSASTLSPSHGLPADDRVAHRYVPLIDSYKPKADSWRRQYEFYLKNPFFSYTKLTRKSTEDRLTPQDIFEEFFAYKRHETPSKIYRPVSLTRWQYGGAYSSGKLSGSDLIAPYRYPNYDRAEDRPYMRSTYQVRSYGVPYPYRQYMRLYEGGYDPKRVLITYVRNAEV